MSPLGRRINIAPGHALCHSPTHDLCGHGGSAPAQRAPPEHGRRETDIAEEEKMDSSLPEQEDAEEAKGGDAHGRGRSPQDEKIT